jgi:hypothetical protein
MIPEIKMALELGKLQIGFDHDGIMKVSGYY